MSFHFVVTVTFFHLVEKNNYVFSREQIFLIVHNFFPLRNIIVISLIA